MKNLPLQNTALENRTAGCKNKNFSVHPTEKELLCMCAQYKRAANLFGYDAYESDFSDELKSEKNTQVVCMTVINLVPVRQITFLIHNLCYTPLVPRHAPVQHNAAGSFIRRRSLHCTKTQLNQCVKQVKREPKEKSMESSVPCRCHMRYCKL